MIKKYIPAKEDFTFPTSWIGRLLQPNQKRLFDLLVKEVDRYFDSNAKEKNMLEILDVIEETKGIGINESIPVLDELITFLRHKILYNESLIVYYTMILLDVMVKNSGYRVHILVGRKTFMKTLSLTARRNLAKRGISNQRVAEIIIGISCFSSSYDLCTVCIYLEQMKIASKHGERGFSRAGTSTLTSTRLI
jgi:hypothetical protein